MVNMGLCIKSMLKCTGRKFIYIYKYSIYECPVDGYVTRNSNYFIDDLLFKLGLMLLDSQLTGCRLTGPQFSPFTPQLATHFPSGCIYTHWVDHNWSIYWHDEGWLQLLYHIYLF